MSFHDALYQLACRVYGRERVDRAMRETASRRKGRSFQETLEAAKKVQREEKTANADRRE